MLSTKKPVQVLQIIHLAILVGISLFALVVVCFMPVPLQADYPTTALYAMGGVSAVCLLLAFTVKAKLTDQARSQTDLAKCWQQYRTAHIVFLAMLEAATLLLIIGYLLSAQWWTQLFILPLAILVYVFPTEQYLMSQLNWTESNFNKVI